MGPNPIQKTFVRTAVAKGIRDIKDSPKRGIRNLVELGDMFSTGRFQKEFFRMAWQQLGIEQSAYYRLVEGIVRGADEKNLSTFGMNLGYNSWTHGAAAIRETEARQGFNIPWTILLQLAGDGLRAEDLRSAIAQGRQLGIYCYMLFIDETYRALDKALEALEAERECAFVVFLPAALVTKRLAQRILRARTIYTVVSLCGADEAAPQNALAALRKEGCPCGGFDTYDALAGAPPSRGMLEKPLRLGLHSYFLVRQNRYHTQSENKDYEALIDLRRNLDAPCFPIDLYEDIAYIDKIISDDACLAGIYSDGSLHFTNVGEEEAMSGYNIRDLSLRDALSRTMPKKRPGEGVV